MTGFKGCERNGQKVKILIQYADGFTSELCEATPRITSSGNIGFSGNVKGTAIRVNGGDDKDSVVGAIVNCNITVGRSDKIGMAKFEAMLAAKDPRALAAVAKMNGEDKAPTAPKGGLDLASVA
jgi:hypothetical protein